MNAVQTGAASTSTRRGADVHVEQLVKRFGQGDRKITAVDGITLNVPPGQVVAVTGSSGSGKSTLLHLLGAIERADEGSVRVNGVEVTTMRSAELAVYRRSVGFVFQRFHLLPALTALDNVLAPVLPRKVDFDRTQRARELLAAVGLAHRERAHPGDLSGGQQQRVAIARALIAAPRLLLADEPTGNLDSATGAEVMELMVGLGARQGTTLLIATHEADIAAGCQRVIQLHDGRLISDEVRS